MTFDPLTLRDMQTKELSLQISGFDEAMPFTTPRQNPYFSIFLVSNGKGKAMRDGADFPFEAPCLLCFSIYQPYALIAAGDLEGVVLDFHPSFFCLFEHRHEVSCNGVLFNNLYDTPVVGLGPGDMQTLLTIAGQIRGELSQRDDPDKDILLSFLKVFLINASRIKMEQQLADTAGAQKAAPILADLMGAIEKNFKTLHQPGEYEKLLHVSAAVLNKASKAYFRKTLTALIAERLIIEAKRLLYLTARPVKEIAFELGYADEFYFSRFFKKNVGVSPVVFREKVGFDKGQGAVAF
ncbi:MAG TPA: helix-turn-helix domain-containing protein [Puia sp.]|nr:helix-turn-helix domain-containing protein [Puia sp.]